MNEFERQQEQRVPQSQSHQPGHEYEMIPEPIYIQDDYKGSGKLTDKVAIISGGDSGIGRATAVHFAREGAHIVIIYLEEDEDAKATRELIRKEERRCLLLKGDVGDRDFCVQAIQDTLQEFGQLDIVINNAAEQHSKESLEEISAEQLQKTFRTNFFGYFYLAQAALPKLKTGSVIINTSSVTSYRGSHHLIDYASTKGAITAFTRSLAQSVANRGIRVNGVAPGPIWTPLIPASFDAERVESFGANTLLKRAGQPCEVAPSYVFLASQDGSYFTGQMLHPNGGGIVST